MNDRCQQTTLPRASASARDENFEKSTQFIKVLINVPIMPPSEVVSLLRTGAVADGAAAEVSEGAEALVGKILA